MPAAARHQDLDSLEGLAGAGSEVFLVSLVVEALLLLSDAGVGAGGEDLRE